MKKIVAFFWGVVEDIEQFFLVWGLRILIVLFIGIIIHNLLKIGDIFSHTDGEYKNFISIDGSEDKQMNVYQIGQGSKTIVILPGFGSQSPVLQYKAIAKNLSKNYKVVIIEYFGYGFSTGNTKSERSNANIADEIVKALDGAGISGPYYLMPHSISKLYAIRLQQKRPDLVAGIISIDGAFPEEIKDQYYKDYYGSMVTNVNITSIFELTGFERVLSYVRPSTFYIDKMKEMPDVYTSEDIKIYRNRIGASYLTRTMVKEIDKVIDNMNELKDYKYPSSLPVLELLSQERVDEYKEAKDKKGATADLGDLTNHIITNSSIQKVVILEGDHALQLSNPSEVVHRTNNFLSGN